MGRRSTTKKSAAKAVTPAANFNLYDGVNLMCFASHRKSAVAICNNLINRCSNGVDTPQRYAR